MGNFAERLADIPGASSLFWLDELKSSKEVMIRLSNNAWVKAEADSDCMYAALLAVELIVETVKNSSKVKGTSLTSKLVTTLDKFNPKVNQDRIMIKTASVLDRFGNVKNNDVFKTRDLTPSSNGTPLKQEMSDRAMQFVSSLDSQERTNSYTSRANEKLKRRSGSDTLTDPEDFQEDSQRGAYETPPPLSYRSPRVESDMRHDTLDEAEIQGKNFARQHHGSHIINTLNMARSRSRSKLQQENMPEQGIYQRPANFDPYHKYDHDSRMYTRYTDRQPLRESSTNESNENSSFEYDDDRESVLDESDRYDSQSVMPGDISQFSKKSSAKASSRKWLEGDFVESEVQFTF